MLKCGILKCFLAINQAKSPQHFESEGGGGFVLETNQLTPEPPMPSGELPSAETIITLLKEYQAKNERKDILSIKHSFHEKWHFM